MANDAVYLGSVYGYLELRKDKWDKSIAQASSDLDKLEKATDTRMGALGKSFTKAGTALSVGLTVPLTIFGKQAVDIATDTEVAWKEVQKVYGSTAGAFQRDSGMMTEAVETLALKFGKTKLEVIDALAAISAIGYEGSAAIDVLTQSIEFSTTGQMDLATAMAGVVAISKTYNVEGDALRATLASLNTVENSTAASMADLNEAVQTAGSVGKVSGVSIGELSAMMAVLRERAVPASEAAEGLKTIFTRLRTTTKDSEAIYAKYGFTIQNTNGTLKESDQILTDLAALWPKLTDVEREELSMANAGLFQKNKFLILMDDLAKANSTYASTLGAIGDEEANVSNYTKEMNIFLDTNKTKIAQAKVAWDDMKVAVGGILADVFVPLATTLSKLAKSFSELNPGVQKFVVYVGIGAAALGPILVNLGLMLQGISLIGKSMPLITGAFGVLKGAALGLGQALVWLVTNPIGWIILAIIALAAIGYLVYKNWDEIKAKAIEVWGAISTFLSGVWTGLVTAFQSAWGTISTFFTNVWTTISTAFTNFVTVTIPNFINGVVAFFMALPGLILQWLWQTFVLNPVYVLGVLWVLFTEGIPALIAAIVQWFSELPGKIMAWWNKTIADAQATWNYLKVYVPQKANEIKNSVVDYITNLVAQVKALWERKKAEAKATWDWLKEYVPQKANELLTGVINWLSQLPGKAMAIWTKAKDDAVTSFKNMWSAISSELSSWPGRLWDWGVKMVESLINGIKSKIGEIVNAFKEGMNAARGFLEGHSPPPKGPFKDIDKWGENIGLSWVEGFRSAFSGLEMPMLGTPTPSFAPVTASGAGDSVVHAPSFNVYLGMYAGSDMEKRSIAKDLNDAYQEYLRGTGQTVEES